MEAAEHATAAAEEAEDRDAAEDQAAAASQDAALTLHGMVRRVARTAGETSWVRSAPLTCPGAPCNLSNTATGGRSAKQCTITRIVCQVRLRLA